MAPSAAMPKLVVDGALLQCSMGTAPAKLTVLPSSGLSDQSRPLATVQDARPMANINPFVMCRSTANPQVALATAASFGVLSPQPCVPVIVGAWTPGSDVVTLEGSPALHDASTCSCVWAGVISVSDAGTVGLSDSE